MRPAEFRMLLCDAVKEHASKSTLLARADTQKPFQHSSRCNNFRYNDVPSGVLVNDGVDRGPRVVCGLDQHVGCLHDGRNGIARVPRRCGVITDSMTL